MSTKKPAPPAQKPGHHPSATDQIVAVDESARSEWKSVVAKLLAPAKFTNTLPEIPFDPKFLNRPLSSLHRHVLYGVTSLDHEYKIPVLSEPDMGVCPNLVDPELYRVPESVDVPSSFAEADEALIEQAESRGTVQGERVYRTQMEQTWMRRSDYMANEAYQANPIAQYRSRTDTMLSYRNKIEAGEERKTTAEKIADIESTFQCPDLAELKHPTKPGLKAVSITPFVPSRSDVWSNLYTQLIFDDCPYLGDSEEDGLSAVIKPFRENAKKAARDNKAAQQLLGYLRPKEKEETESSEPQTEEHGALHSWHRNYSFTKEPYEKVFVFTEVADGKMMYNVIDAKLTVHNHTARTFTSDRVFVKRRGFKSSELEPRRKRQRGMMTAAEIEGVTEQDRELEKEEQEEKERAAAASVEEQLAADEQDDQNEDGGAGEANEDEDVAPDGQEPSGEDPAGTEVMDEDLPEETADKSPTPEPDHDD